MLPSTVLKRLRSLFPFGLRTEIYDSSPRLGINSVANANIGSAALYCPHRISERKGKMKTATRLALLLVFAIFLMAAATKAYADTVDLTYTGAGVSGNLTLTLTPDGGGVYSVTAVRGTANGATVTGLYPDTGPSDTQVLGGQTFTFYTYPGIFEYDNLFYTSGNPALINVFDVYGLLFSVEGLSSPLSLAYCGSYFGDSCPEGSYWSNGPVSIPVTITTTVTPEPSSLMMLGVGLVGLASLTLKKSL